MGRDCLNIALITNKDLHHKYWVSQLCKSNNISLIIHPTGINQSIINKIKYKKYRYYGNFNLILKALSILYGKLSRKGLAKSISKAEDRYFSEYE